LDLIGLPPTPAEYAAFEKDSSPDAFAKVVDRLLASPHYGERWGRVWLDLARYAEDDISSLFPGGHLRYPNAYLYRDWVVQAMNDDMTYDQFVKAQLAGDLLDSKTRYKTLPATGFFGLGPWLLNTAVAEVARPGERNDRIDVISRGLLGLTVACARCHNHKYDPIPTTDYYSLAGVFLNTSYHEYPQVPKAVVEKKAKLDDLVEAKENEAREFREELEKEASESFVLQTSNYLQGVWEATNSRQKKDVAAIVESRKLDYEVLERWIGYMAKPSKWHHQKEAWQAMMKEGAGEQQARNLAEDFQANVVRVMRAKDALDAENKVIEAKDMKGTVPDRRPTKPNDFKTNEQYCFKCTIPYKRMPEQDFLFWEDVFDSQIPDDGYDTEAVRQGLQYTSGPYSFRGWALQRRVSPERWARLTTLQKELRQLRAQAEAATYPVIHGVEDNPTVSDLEVSIGGSPDNLGPKVPRHFLTVLSDGDPQPFKKGSGRLELAEDIVKQPIAMRVIVNRIWKEHFGTGIVETPDNFGTTGERPTNPELLEYLASDFVRNGMSIKKLHRAIMLSATYQLSTEDNNASSLKDEANRLYWRANQKRLTAEELRDSLLAVSGSLSDSIGGPSETLTPTSTRRTIYGAVNRLRLDPFLETFDFPSPAASAAKRFTTTVPLQRLFLMNSDFMQIRAEQVAKAVEDEPDSRARIRKIYSLVYGREPSEQEVSKGLDYVRSEPLRQYEEQQERRSGESIVEGPSETAASMGPPSTDPSSNIDEVSSEMMSGVNGPGGRLSQLHYQATVWGRYVKVLLGSSEFLYVN
jgi:hypothetical protein